MLPGVAQEIVQLLYALLPGFLAAWVFYGLSAHPKPSPFERTVQALIYTMIVQVLLSPIRLAFVSIGNFASIGNWTQNVELAWSVFIAVFIGISFAGLANNSTIHSWLGSRNWRFAKVPVQGDDTGWRWTKRTSYPSEWYGAFNENRRYVVLHLSDGRRIYGWPEEWPDQAESGHFVVAEPEWLEEDEKGKNVRLPLTNVWSILIPSASVQLVEFTATDAELKGDSNEPKGSSTSAQSTDSEA